MSEEEKKSASSEVQLSKQALTASVNIGYTFEIPLSSDEDSAAVIEERLEMLLRKLGVTPKG